MKVHHLVSLYQIHVRSLQQFSFRKLEQVHWSWNVCQACVPSNLRKGVSFRRDFWDGWQRWSQISWQNLHGILL